ncbi:MAG: hypothetical protein Q8861_04620 [Bacteroidota bacterium]|nr:hypothetical protein [Bacteroidota bacterium]
MDILFDILKYTLPAALVVFATYVVMKQLHNENEKHRRYEFLRTSAQLITPARLQAYERLTLFIERMIPDNLVMRQPCSSMTAAALQAQLLEIIRNEYEHNVSQQLYVGNDVWIMVKNAKESMLQLVNSCATRLPAGSSGIALAQLIIETYNAASGTTLDIALNMLKKEMNERLG